MDHLYDKLRDYSASAYYGFHMPGHKRNAELTGAKLPYEIDITEIEGFDDLHHAEGILKAAQQRAASVCHAEETHYLINGSTVGILSAVLGCTRRGDKILMARGCHKSVYNAVYMNELLPVYLWQDIMEGTGLNRHTEPEEVERLLQEDPDIKAVVITSPTYDGVVSDVRRIAGIVHKRGIPLILDEAHGAHFGFHPYFPENGNVQGADIVIHSLHKTLPALTQTALLHMNGEIADRKRVRRYLHMLQSSSPSYVLMAGIDECIRMLSDKSSEVFECYVNLLERTRNRLRTLRHLRLIETEYYDRSKIVISAAGCMIRKEGELKKFTGKDLYSILNEKYFLQMEMASASYIVAMTSPADSGEGMDRLVGALSEIDGKLAKSGNEKERIAGNNSEYVAFSWKKDISNETVYSPCQAEMLAEQGKYIEYIPISECRDRVVLEYAYVYPPGIPLTVPGERVSEDAADMLGRYEGAGFRIEGTEIRGKIKVLAGR